MDLFLRRDINIILPLFGVPFPNQIVKTEFTEIELHMVELQN